MLSHSYNARLNSFTSIEEGTASNDTVVDTPPLTSANTSQFSETATLNINLEKQMTSRFVGLDS